MARPPIAALTVALLAWTFAGCEPTIPLTVERRCSESAPCGRGTHCSPAGLCVPDNAPLSRTPPPLSGTAVDGQLLYSEPGGWEGTTPLEFAYRWERCDASGACRPIAGAAGASYRAQSSDLGRRLRAVVSATNAAGGASAASGLSPEVVPGPPVNLALPAVDGMPLWGEQLTVSVGNWAGTPPLTVAVQWQLCVADSCQDQAEATGPSLQLGDAELGHAVRVVVTATNPHGKSVVQSPATDPVAALPPAWLSLPTISGTPSVGQELTASPGTWSGSPPPVLTYQWRACDGSGTSCVDLNGQHGTRYVVGYEAASQTVQVVVSASNLAGQASAMSAPTAPVPLPPPSNTTLPTVNGSAAVGQLLAGGDGTWRLASGVTRQWQRCGPTGAACTSITGASSSTYQVTSADEGKTLRFRVTAANTSGSATAVSLPTSPVLPAGGS